MSQKKKKTNEKKMNKTIGKDKKLKKDFFFF